MEYRVVEAIGSYFITRYEVQKKYSYYNNGQKVTGWKMVYCSKSKDLCERAMNRYKAAIA